MRILHVASEMYPFVKTGGLGDVVGSLPFFEAGINDTEVRILLPGFRQLTDVFPAENIVFEGIILNERLAVSYHEYKKVGIYIIHADHLYHRENLYHDNSLQAYSDNVVRFGILGYIGAELTNYLDPLWRAEVVHAHDWHAGLTAAYIRQKNYQAKTIFTIHNLAYAGNFAKKHLWDLQLDTRMFNADGLEFYDNISFLKAGLVFSNHVTTVSKSYAEEITLPDKSYGFGGLLKKLYDEKKLTGILNGVDYSVWDPEHDELLPKKYSFKNMSNKKLLKKNLQARFNLKITNRSLLITVISRLVDQKGIYFIIDGIKKMLDMNIQIIFLGSGKSYYQDKIESILQQYKGQVGVYIGYNEELSHQLIAGSDAMLIPSVFEPCGLTQLFALKYGTIPLVRSTGGLKDTVINLEHNDINLKVATGFSFSSLYQNDFDATIARMYSTWSTRQKIWKVLQKNGMAENFSWKVSALQYRSLYLQTELGE